MLTGTLRASPRSQEMQGLPLQSNHKCIWGCVWGFPGCRVGALRAEGLSLVLAVILSLQEEEQCPTLHTGNNRSHPHQSHRSVSPLAAPLPSIKCGWNWVRSLNVVVQGRSTHTALLSLVSLGNSAKNQGRTWKEAPHTASLHTGAAMQGALRQHIRHRPLPTMALANELLHQPEDAALGQSVPCKNRSGGLGGSAETSRQPEALPPKGGPSSVHHHG